MEAVDAKTTDSGNEFYDLWVLLARTRDALQCARQQELRQYGLSWEQLATLFAIQSSGNGATIADISRAIFRQPHSVSEMVIRLEKQGLVKKSRSLPRKNQVCVTLTEKGYQAWLKSSREKTTARVLSSLSKAKRERLQAYLTVLLNASLEEIGPKPRYLFRP